MNTELAPDSGIQWLMALGATFVILSVNPGFGYFMLALGIGGEVSR